MYGGHTGTLATLGTCLPRLGGNRHPERCPGSRAGPRCGNRSGTCPQGERGGRNTSVQQGRAGVHADVTVIDPADQATYAEPLRPGHRRQARARGRCPGAGAQPLDRSAAGPRPALGLTIFKGGGCGHPGSQLPHPSRQLSPATRSGFPIRHECHIHVVIAAWMPHSCRYEAGRRTGGGCTRGTRRSRGTACPAPWALSGEGRGPRRHGRPKSGARRRLHLVSRCR